MGRFVSAGATDVGNVRGNNEDRYYIDDQRGIYLVVDGMGGQAAGEEAAEIAVKTVRGRLERQTESGEQRVREAIALANNAIFEAASKNPEWHGMACVLTLALVENGHAIIGHVGDSRAYLMRAGKIEKITRDHSPVGEREDSGELSEEAAMKHPRRNEVYRDVGSTPRTPDDDDFIDVRKVKVGADSALLLCSDGLSDVVPARRILQVVEENASNGPAAVQTLVRAAVSDGKDNVSVVLVEGEKFAESVTKPVAIAVTQPLEIAKRKRSFSALFFVLGLLLGLGAWAAFAFWPHPKPLLARVPKTIHVASQGAEYSSIPEAISSASAGDTIELAAGTYPDKILLRNGITLTSANHAVLTGGLVADSVSDAVVHGLTFRDGALEIRSSDVGLDGLEIESDVTYEGTSKGSLHASRVSGDITVADKSAPLIELNFITGDIEFAAGGGIRLDGNGLGGTITLAKVPADLLERNAVAGGKKALHVTGGAR